MKKVLFVATVVKTHINVFHIPYLMLFKEHGYETFVCARNDFAVGEKCEIPYCDYFYDIPFSRRPISIENIRAYQKLKNVVLSNDFDIIHCHTPMGGVITRLIKRNAATIKAKIIYTAHGFHFFRGAAIKNWFVYYPIEVWLAQYTDVLITINQEDYRISQKMKAGKVELVNGVGIELKRFVFSSIERDKQREELQIAEEEFVLISIGELIKRKNHEVVIKAIAGLNNHNIKYYICGDGDLRDYLSNIIVKLSMEEQIFLVGFKKNITPFLQIADAFIFSSLQEGLPVSLMEAMSASLPVIASDVRGNHDLVVDNTGGILVKENSEKQYAQAIKNLMSTPEKRIEMGNYNKENIKKYSLDSVKKEMERIYFK